MHFNVLNRKVHFWASFIAAVPVLVIVASGILLQMKKQLDWVQPPEQRGTSTVPVIARNEEESIIAPASATGRLHDPGPDEVNVTTGWCFTL